MPGTEPPTRLGESSHVETPQWEGSRGKPLHVAQINFVTDSADRPPVDLLHAWPSLGDIAEAASGAGVRVTVIQASRRIQQLKCRGVDYHFLPFGSGTKLPAGRCLDSLLGRLAPDVLHVHGLGFARDVLSLAASVPDIPIVLQDHADRPPGFWRRRTWRQSFSAAAALTFCSQEQVRPFVEAGLVSTHTKVYEIPECPSRFCAGDQAEARRLTGLSGDPCLLWVGHLDANKDPLTVLQGVSEAVRRLPGLQLWCCFGTGPLLAAVRSRIEGDVRLHGRVHLLGRVPHERIEHLMRAADVFVLGSHHEGSGYSLIEALACGVPPVVTDIPSFRTLTADGRVGALWACGDSGALAAALEAVCGLPVQAARAAVLEHFARELSFSSVGRKFKSLYAELNAQKLRRT